MIQFACGFIIGGIIGEILGAIVMGLCIAGDDEYSDYDFEEECTGEESAACFDCDFWSDCREEYV